MKIEVPQEEIDSLAPKTPVDNRRVVDFADEAEPGEDVIVYQD